ncbi:MAG: UDP-N-acetylmuramate dehydrogenase [Deltaproteobacteria bacterium]|nr:UDP-N-acetylmuramate dehydrogenase [Deltaproteobacteria bacterium]
MDPVSEFRPDPTWVKEVTAACRGRVLVRAPLNHFTTFKIGGPADAIIIPVDQDDLITVIRLLKRLATPWMVLGRGSNLLVLDGGYNGAMINLAQAANQLVITPGSNREEFFMEAGAGVPLCRALRITVAEGLTGLEFTTGIPGSVGGAVIMNAGTRDGRIEDVTEEVTFLTKEETMASKIKKDLCFQYRHLAVDSDEMVVSATFKLKKGTPDLVRKTVKAAMDYRKQTQPKAWPSAGSVFKNPPGMSAGALIDQAGLKGTRIGDAQVSEKHANFIVNLGHARAKDVLSLMNKVQRTVKENFGVALEPEIKVIGRS